jgi:hypothetical protein
VHFFLPSSWWSVGLRISFAIQLPDFKHCYFLSRHPCVRIGSFAAAREDSSPTGHRFLCILLTTFSCKPPHSPDHDFCRIFSSIITFFLLKETMHLISPTIVSLLPHFCHPFFDEIRNLSSKVYPSAKDAVQDIPSGSTLYVPSLTSSPLRS